MKKKIFFLMVAAISIWNHFSNSAEIQTIKENLEPKSQFILSQNFDYSSLDSKVAAYLNDGTEYSVYLTYPNQTTEAYIYNSQKWRSASMIKVFILAAVMEKVRDVEISLDEVITLQSSDKVGGAGVLVGYVSGSQLSLRQVLRLMITESDNTATNIVINRVGMYAINDYIRRNGYNDTILQRKMMDMDAIYAGRENYSSVRDLGDIFVKIYNHNCVGEAYDDIMIDFLKGQTDTDCFPAALPDKVIAHKTGALNGLYDDGGIIYDNYDSSNDAILVIMTENFTSEYTAIEHMKRFARSVCYTQKLALYAQS